MALGAQGRWGGGSAPGRAWACALGFAVLCAAALTGCGSGDGGAGTTDGGGGKDGGVVIIGVDVDEVDGDGAGSQICEPSQPTCVDSTHWALCTKSGRGFGIQTECAQSALCDPAFGYCRIPFCQPETSECLGLRSYQVCNANGSDYEPEERHCGIEQVCHEGECMRCVPGQPGCADLTTPGQCSADGTTLTPLAACPEGQGCHEFTGECRPKVCIPGVADCASLTTYHDCLPSGTGFDTFLRGCAEESLCTDGKCLFKSCVPLVMLVVDRSGSMEGLWPSVRASVKSVVASNPQAAFGLMSFPTDGSCGVSSYPSLPFGYPTAETLDAWFDANAPAGATPLSFVMERVLKSAEFIWGGYGGALVVLSDGADTCSQADVPAFLGTWTEGLRTQANVKSYVIGYNFFGPADQLDAIAANGGTEFSVHIPAGNEAELTQAFQAVINDFKLCVTQP